MNFREMPNTGINDPEGNTLFSHLIRGGGEYCFDLIAQFFLDQCCDSRICVTEDK